MPDDGLAAFASDPNFEETQCHKIKASDILNKKISIEEQIPNISFFINRDDLEFTVTKNGFGTFLYFWK